MCGIAGIINCNNSVEAEKLLQQMTDAIAHRGPDGEGHWQNPEGTVVLGHRRLSIVDLSHEADQPMHYLSRYTVVFNGEIYNYKELKAALLQKGYSFQTQSDTEVLLALFDCYRENCLQHINGMFTLVLWDDKEKELFIARDRFGEKPFYYSVAQDDTFFFASEMKALWAGGISKTVKPSAVIQLLQHTALTDPEDLSATYYSGIFQLPASHYMIVRADGTIKKKERYWNLSSVSVNTSIKFSDACYRFRELLSDSVKLRLQADVTVGSSLSGGLDSSSIVTLINKIKPPTQHQKTFSARFEGFGKDEGVYVEMLSKQFNNIEVVYNWPAEDQLIHEFEDLCKAQEEPFTSASIFAQYKTMESAKQNNVTVLLDGQGADEQLGGYLWYYQTYINQLFLERSNSYKKELVSYNEFHGQALPFAPLSERETMRMKWSRTIKSFAGIKPAYNYDVRNELLQSLTHTGLVDLLRYCDRNSMAHSREVRLPFLDHRLVEFVYSLPLDFIFHEGWTKYVLRKSMEDLLPSEITWRKDKIGYEPPQTKWLQNPFFKNRIDATRSYVENNIAVNGALNDWILLMCNEYFKLY